MVEEGGTLQMINLILHNFFPWVGLDQDRIDRLNHNEVMG